MIIQVKFFVRLNERILPVTAAQTPREVLNRVDSNCLKDWIWSDISRSLIQNWYQQSPNIMDIKSNILDFGILTLTLNFYFKNLMLTSHLENTSQAMWRFLHGWKKCRYKNFQVPQIKVVGLFYNLIVVPQTNKLVGWRRLRWPAERGGWWAFEDPPPLLSPPQPSWS